VTRIKKDAPAVGVPLAWSVALPAPNVFGSALPNAWKGASDSTRTSTKVDSRLN
jgi:hypothetical protein